MRGGCVKLRCFFFFFFLQGLKLNLSSIFLFWGWGVLTISAEQFFLSPLCIFISPLYLYIYTALCMNCDIENIVIFFFWKGGGAADFKESCLYCHPLIGVPSCLSATNFFESTV